MNNYKVGQKVYIKALGLWAIIERVIGGVIVMAENKNRYAVTLNEIEPFIEPLFKVGDKFIVHDGKGWTTEIVKASLNKKKGEYSYLAFDEDGYARGIDESELRHMRKVSKEKVEIVKMTVPQLEAMFVKTMRGMGNKNVKLKIVS